MIYTGAIACIQEEHHENRIDDGKQPSQQKRHHL